MWSVKGFLGLGGAVMKKFPHVLASLRVGHKMKYLLQKCQSSDTVHSLGMWRAPTVCEALGEITNFAF